MTKISLWLQEIVKYKKILQSNKRLKRWQRESYKLKIQNLIERISLRRLRELKQGDLIDMKLLFNNPKEYKDSIEELYEDMEAQGSTPSMDMLKILKKINVIKPEQPGSLNKTYIYQYDKSKKYKFNKLLDYIYLILNNFFGTFYGFINKPVYLFTQNKLTIYVNYYIPEWKKRKIIKKKLHGKWYTWKTFINRYPKLVARNMWKYNKFPAKTASQLNWEFSQLVKVLSNLLFNQNNNMLMPNGHEHISALNEHNDISDSVNREFNRPKVVLELKQIRFPYLDSTILSKYIALHSNKRSFRRLFNNIIRKANVITKGIIKNPKYKHFFLGATNKNQIEIHSSINSVLTGLKVRISGRLITQRIVPKRTVQQKEIGNFKRTNNSIVDYSMFTSKNKRGAYTIKVWTTSNIDCLPKEFSAEN